jgi:hypothetical protein
MEAATVNVAESADLMTNPKESLEETLQGVGENIGAIIDVQPIKHICLVGNNRAPVQGRDRFLPHPEEARQRRLEGWATGLMVRPAMRSIVRRRAKTRSSP